MNDRNLLLELRSVTKRYASHTALRQVSLTVRRGETLLVSGGNGSGKSTLLRIMSGLVPPSEGAVAAPGRPVIGYAPDRLPGLAFTSREYLLHMGAMRGIPRRKLAERIEGLHAKLRLPTDVPHPMRAYSKGMLQKVNLMQAMLIPPDVLLLDEPFSGLDPQSREELTDALAALAGEGVAIVAAAHEDRLTERLPVRRLALRAGVLETGADRGPGEEPPPGVSVRCIGPADALERLRAFPGVAGHACEGGSCLYRLVPEQSDAFLLAALQAGASIDEVRRTVPAGGGRQA